MNSGVLSSNDYLVEPQRQCYKYFYLHTVWWLCSSTLSVCGEGGNMGYVSSLEKSYFHKKFSAFNTVFGISLRFNKCLWNA